MKMHEMWYDEQGGDIWTISGEEEFMEAWAEWAKRKIPFKHRLKRQPPSELEKQD